MNLDSMIEYLVVSLEYRTAGDIIDFPEARAEFQPYIKRCDLSIPREAIPYVVLNMLIEEQGTLSYYVKRSFYNFFKSVKSVFTKRDSNG